MISHFSFAMAKVVAHQSSLVIPRVPLSSIDSPSFSSPIHIGLEPECGYLSSAYIHSGVFDMFGRSVTLYYRWKDACMCAQSYPDTNFNISGPFVVELNIDVEDPDKRCRQTMHRFNFQSRENGSILYVDVPVVVEKLYLRTPTADTKPHHPLHPRYLLCHRYRILDVVTGTVTPAIVPIEDDESTADKDVF